jgi:hypothetical protein
VVLAEDETDLLLFPPLRASWSPRGEPAQVMLTGRNANRSEYIAGLVPTDPLSRFRVRVEPVAGQPGQMAIIFSPVVAGRAYTVKAKASLTDASWTPLGNVTTSDNGPERTVIDLSPAGSGKARFYRVEISLP